MIDLGTKIDDPPLSENVVMVSSGTARVLEANTSVVERTRNNDMLSMASG